MSPNFHLAKVDFESYLEQYATYKVFRNNNRFNYGEQSIKLSIIDDKEFCKHIYMGQIQIGGVIQRNQSIKHPFLQPGYLHLTEEVIAFLHSQIAGNGQPDKGISCLPSDTRQAEAFGKLGYSTVRKLRCMIGPVRKLGWSVLKGYGFRDPDTSDSATISKLFYDANIDDPWHQPITLEHFKWGTELYFDKSKTKQLLDASSLCFEESTGNPVGACLVSLEEGFPFIYDIHVLKEHRRRGLAYAMMCKAMNRIAGEHRYMRLFVIDGNPAKELYSKLGFIAGKPVFIMKYTHKE